MGFDALGIVELMTQRGDFNRIANNPMLQFGIANQPLLGATLLPEKTVDDNQFTEEGVRYRTPIANDGTRYSPVQLKKGMITGSVDVKLGYSDIGSEMRAGDYDAFIRLIAKSTGTPENLDNPSMQGIADITKWIEATTALPLVNLNEKQRWDSIVDASVVRVGDGGYTETVPLPNPVGHRVNAAGDWMDEAYDPYDDIVGIVDAAAEKNYVINRIIAGRPVISALCQSPKVRMRLGMLSIAGGIVVGMPGRATREQVNGLLAADGIPPIEEYNASYQTQTGSDYYLKRNAMVFCCTTGRTANIELPDSTPLMLQDTLGYVAVGRAAGQTKPGRVLKSYAYDNKPPRIESEGWQASWPVLLDPEAVYVLKEINTTRS